jgi:hypothetical protein
MDKSSLIGVFAASRLNGSPIYAAAPVRPAAAALPSDLMGQLHHATFAMQERLNSHLAVSSLTHPAFSLSAASTALHGYQLAYAVIEREIFELFPELLTWLNWEPPQYVAAIARDRWQLQHALQARVPAAQLQGTAAQFDGYQRASRPAAWVCGAFFVLLGAAVCTEQVRRAVALHGNSAISTLGFFSLSAQQAEYSRRLPNLLLVHIKNELARKQAIAGAMDTLELFIDAMDAAVAAQPANS